MSRNSEPQKTKAHLKIFTLILVGLCSTQPELVGTPARDLLGAPFFFSAVAQRTPSSSFLLVMKSNKFLVRRKVLYARLVVG